MEVQQIMKRNTVCVDRDETVAAAARLMGRCNIGALPVTDSRGKLCGILTDRDVTIRCVAAGKDPDKVLVRAVMSPAPHSLRPAQTCDEAARSMLQNRVRRLPVTEQGRVVGIVSARDLSVIQESREAATQILGIPLKHDIS